MSEARIAGLVREVMIEQNPDSVMVGWSFGESKIKKYFLIFKRHVLRYFLYFVLVLIY